MSYRVRTWDRTQPGYFEDLVRLSRDRDWPARPSALRRLLARLRRPR